MESKVVKQLKKELREAEVIQKAKEEQKKIKREIATSDNTGCWN